MWAFIGKESEHNWNWPRLANQSLNLVLENLRFFLPQTLGQAGLSKLARNQTAGLAVVRPSVPSSLSELNWNLLQ